MIFNDLILMAMRLIGVLLVASGLGMFASWAAGIAGFLVVTGGALLAVAGLSARQQRILSQPSVNGQLEDKRTRLEKFADWVYEVK